MSLRAPSWSSRLLLLQLLVFLSLSNLALAFSARSILSQNGVFSSPSGKLTIQPEVVLPEPKDATALLLFTNAIQSLSERMRNCQANAICLDGSLNAVQLFCQEQADSMGNFPGPVPVVYGGSSTEYKALQEAGAVGVLVPCDWKQDNQDDDKLWTETCQRVWEAGLEPIPELILDEQESWEEDAVEQLVEQVKVALDNEAPVAVVVTINPTQSDDEEDDDSSTPKQHFALPKVPKALSKQIPILGSIRVLAGENRLGLETARFKEHGYTGAFLRSDCVPGFRLQPDLEIVSTFWNTVVSDLKSTKSKSFSFRSKNNMEMSAGEKWAKYQKGVLDSGALGDPEDSYSVVNDAAGEYKGFA